MIDDEILDGTCCSICLQQFKNTEGAVISHGWAVVCKECWSSLTPDKRKNLTKAYFDTQGYTFDISVLYEGRILQLAVKPLNNIDQIVYEVYDKGLLCVVGLNEKINWDADRDISRNLIYEIGRAIELKEKE
jgi:hypothetical protein